MKHIPIIQYGPTHGDQQIVGTIGIDGLGEISGQITKEMLIEAIQALPHGSFSFEIHIIPEPALPKVVGE